MQDNYFDRFVRDKLFKMEVPLVPSDWGILTPALNDALDNLFRDHLEQAEVAYLPVDWERMDAMLNAPTDQLIGQKLRAMTVPYQESDWSALASLMDHPFDSEMRTKLKELSLPFQTADWELLATALGLPFDQALRQKLQNLELPIHVADWEMLSAALGLPLDTLIQEKLQNFLVSQDTADWEGLLATLDQSFDVAIQGKLQSAAIPLMESDWLEMDAALQHPFDQTVRARMDEVAMAPTDMADWEALEAKLDAPFDQAMKEKLYAMELPYQGSDWRKMAALLGNRKVVPLFRDWRTYAAAAAAILLLLLGGRDWSQPAQSGNPTPMAQDKSDIPVIESIDTEENFQTAIQEEESVLPFEQAPDPELGNIAQAENPLDLEGERMEKAEGANEGEIDGDALLPAANNLSTFPLIVGTLEVQNGGQRVNPHPDEVTDKVFPPGVEPEQGPASNKNLESYAQVARPSFDLNGIRLQDQKFGTSLLGYSAYKAEESASVEVPVPLPYPRVGLSVYGAGFTTVSELNEDGKRGFAAGLRAHLLMSKNWSLVTGVLYSEKSFSRTITNTVPLDPSVIEPGSPSTALWISKLDADYKLLEIPILARYTFQKEAPLSFYLQAGFTVMVSLQESYQHYDPRSASNLSQTLSNPWVDPSSYSAALEQYLGELNPTSEQRTINTYIGNLQFAPGLEYKLTPNIHLQFEPYLQLGVLPMGSQQLKMHSAGLGIGVRYLLGK